MYNTFNIPFICLPFDKNIDNINEKEKAKALAYAEKHPEKKTFMQKMLEQQQALEQQQNGSANNVNLSKSEKNKINRDALKEARRRMAEKYGDEYDENDINDD